MAEKKMDEGGQKPLDELRVLVLATTFPRWEGDSEPRFVFDLTHHLAKHVNLWALVPHAPNAKRQEEMRGVRIIRFPYFFPTKLQALCYEGGILPKLKTSWRARLQVPCFLAAQLFFLWKTVRLHKINFIHSHWIIPQGFFAALMHVVYGTPYILTALGADVFAFKGNSLVRWLKKFTLRHAEACAVNSFATQKALETLSPKTRFEYIPNGVDKELFSEKQKNDGLKKELGIDGIFLLAVGRFAEKKGFKYLIDAMPEVLAKHSSIKLVLVGFGPEEQSLKQQVHDLGLSDAVIFPGAKSGVELASYYATADIFIGPSIVVPGGDTEGQGIVFVEALSAKAAVIATNVGGIPDMIKDGETGLLVPEKNSDAIAEKILVLCQNPELRNKLTTQGRQLVEDKYSWETLASQMLGLYKKTSLTG